MVISSEELDRIADDIDKQRRITDSVYCGHCGYNLRTLPYAYQCPECGKEYNARPLSLKGIFIRYQAELPIREAFITLMGAASTVALGYGAFNPRDNVRMVICFVFALITVLFSAQSITRFRLFINSIRIGNRIRLEEEAEEYSWFEEEDG